MPAIRTFKNWYLVHKWTSLVCTAFVLLMCVTGLPLLFEEEINDQLGNKLNLPEASAGAPWVSLNTIVEAARALRPPDEFPVLARQGRDEPNVWSIMMGATPDALEATEHLYFDAFTGELLLRYKQGLTHVLYKLHVDLFAGPEGSLAGLVGMLFMGFMGLLFVVAIISGAVVYGPYMRKLPFGAVRSEVGPRLKWLDLHNLLGIVLFTWALVVGATGVLNELARPIYSQWQNTQLAAMIAPWKGKPAPTQFVSPQVVLETARQAEPTMIPNLIWFPGQPRAGNHHYSVFMRWDGPLTRRLQKVVLIDAQTGTVAATSELPWYITALRVSQPLHFGDYGGLPLKVLWGVLDLLTIIVLGSGLYLWFVRRKIPIEARMAEMDRIAMDRVAKEATP